MAVPYEKVGRTRQKGRTRAALIAAARELLARGGSPTVEEAAALASISRTTAYRYFPNQRSLLVAAHPEVEASSLLGSAPPSELAARLDAVVAAIARLTIEAEPALRAMLRMSLEPGPQSGQELPLRRGRRMIWVEDALSPLRGQLPPAKLRRLVIAIAAVVGIDSLVWLVDVARLSRKRAIEIMLWSARGLLEFELAGGSPPVDHGSFHEGKRRARGMSPVRRRKLSTLPQS